MTDIKLSYGPYDRVTLRQQLTGMCVLSRTPAAMYWLRPVLDDGRR